MAKIETVAFDLYEVLLHGMLGMEFTVADVLGVDKDEFRKSHFKGEKLQQLFEGRLSENDFWDMVIAESRYPASVDGYESTRDFLKSAIRSNFTEIPGTEKIITALKDVGYQLILLSDTAREWGEYCEDAYSLRELFGARRYSYDVGITKKSPEFFIGALKDAGADSQKTLYIDDKKRNLSVAESAGIRYTYHFADAWLLRTQLGALVCSGAMKPWTL